MSWCWFARLPEPVQGALACATVTDADGVAAGALAAWLAGRKPVADAVRMHARLVDPAGDPAWISLVLLSRERSPLFDDPAVSGALRAAAKPHRSLSSQTGCLRLRGPGRASGYLHGVDAGLDRVSRTPQPALLKDGGRLASSLGAAGKGPGRFSFNAIGKPRPGNVQRLAKLLDNGALRVHIQPQYPLGGAAQAPTNATHAGQLLARLSIREQRGDLAAPSARRICRLADMAVSSLMIPLGTPAPDFALPDLAGTTVRRDDFAAARALLVMFLCNHCPYVRHIEAELSKVLAQRPGLAVVGICTNDVEAYPDDRPERLAEQAQRAGWFFPYLVDHDQQVARAHSAACTPDFFLYDRQRRLAYRGAFDESTPGNGKPVTGDLLRAAVEQVLAGKPVPEPHKPSMGCSIKWRS